MKKVLALVLAVVMVVGMASVATFAKEYKPSEVLQGTFHKTVNLFAPSQEDYKPGDTFYFEFKLGDGASLKLTDFTFTVKLDDEAKEQFAFTKQDGGKFYFKAIGDPTDIIDDAKQTAITFEIGYKGTKESITFNGYNTGYAASDVKTEAEFQNLKDSNKDATVKAEMKVGEYITISDISNPRDVNIMTYDETPSAVAEALEGKNYTPGEIVVPVKMPVSRDKTKLPGNDPPPGGARFVCPEHLFEQVLGLPLFPFQHFHLLTGGIILAEQVGCGVRQCDLGLRDAGRELL